MQQISLSQTAGAQAIAGATAKGKSAISNAWALTHGTGDRKGAWGISGAIGHLLHRLGCLAVMISFPVIAVYMWHINEHCNGSVLKFLSEIHVGGLTYLGSAYPSPTWKGLGYILGFGLLQAILQISLPGKTFRGPPTPKGNVPVYLANGVQSYLATIAILCGLWLANIFNPGAVYDNLGSIVSTSNLFSLAFCAFLYIKGRVAPSSSDSGTTGSTMFDYYWGMELFPRIGPLDIKTWTNCRMGMGGWGVLILCYAIRQAQSLPSGLPSPGMMTSVLLMQIYILKFFAWETGYWASMDIAHDRAGFYLCWGCLVWIPSIYTSPAMYLVRNGTGAMSACSMSLPMAIATFLFGTVMVAMNYAADRQRQIFRKSGGTCLVWGKPAKKIEAKYVTGDGSIKTSLLLASGYWGLARHFHYLPEVLAALAWTVPCGFSSMAPYFYVIFLTSLLSDRAYRDDERCAAKYGKYWDQYKQSVPYRIIPGLF